jgi:succinyl-diaminopimelate desuccinylase
LELKKPAKPEIKKLYDWVDAHQDEIVSALVGVLKIRSLEDEAAPNAPFGKPVREALDYTLNLCRDLGFTVKDVDGFAGHAEFGTGAEMVASLGHLDVVPEGDGWEYPPYGATIKNGYIYARGASDDKGPTYASLFGAKAVMDSGLPIKRRIRVIFGCNEESGFGCVEHYFNVAKEERPVLGFTPDSGFPLIYAEKGIANLVLEKAAPTGDRPLRIVSASGGRRPNMVPDAATARLEGTPEAIAEAQKTLAKFWDKNVSVAQDSEALTISAVGKSAHGSRPQAGDNAVARLARALATLELDETECWLDWVNETNDPTGDALGIAHRDDVAGPLTSNLGILETTADGKIRLTYNIRYPVTWDITSLLAANKPIIDAGGWTLADYSDQPPLYVPLDKEPVATLLRVYREASGDTLSEPETMGGGTYARATPFTVAYGAHFPTSADDYGPAHEPDECISINTLLNATKIYAQALYELANA